MEKYGIDLGQLRWRAGRHALLELDIVFQRFLGKHFDALTEPQLAALEELLLEEDHDLWEWVSGRGECPEPEWKELVDMLHQCSMDHSAGKPK